MAIPPIAPLPQAPSRSDGPVAFNALADPFIAALPPFVLQANALGAAINEALISMGQGVSAAAGSATAAAASATAANASKVAAAQSAIDATNNGEAQVVLAANQVTLAVNAKNSAEVAAAAAQAAAGMPSIEGKAFMALRVNAAGTGVEWAPGVPNTLVGKTGQSIMLGADKLPYWGYAGQQIGDVLVTSRNPGSLYLPANGSIRSQIAYPALFASVGLIGGAIGTAWADYDFGGTNTAFAASLTGTVVVVQSPTQVRRSTDRGQTWVNITIANLVVAASDIKTDGNGTWIILSSATSAPFQCLRSTDDGLTWQLITLPATSSGAGGSWRNLLYCGNNVWIITSSYSSTMMRSTNGGASWATFTHGYPIGSMAAAGSNGAGVVLISAYDGANYTVKKSTDYGATFSSFLTLTAASYSIASDGLGNWAIGQAGTASLRSYDDAATFVPFAVTGGTANNTDILFIGNSIFYLFIGSGAKVIIVNPNGSLSPQSSAANATGRLIHAGNGVIFASSTTANRLSRSIPQFGYDTATQFALPNIQSAIGVNTYIKAKELA